MSACNLDVVKYVGKYFNVPVGAVCYNTDKILTTILDRKNVDGFASIILRLSEKTGASMSKEQTLLSYQWLEYMAMYADQAASNPMFANTFLQEINRALQKSSYLTGQSLTVTDIAAYYVLYPLLEKLSIAEREKLMHSKPIKRVIPLPRQIFPHELKNKSLEQPLIFHPQPFAYPGYPVVLYL